VFGARAVASNLNGNDVAVAVTMGLLVEHLMQRPNGLITFAGGGAEHILATEQLAQNRGQSPRPGKPGRAEIYEAVRDVVERRTDQRPASANAFDAFSEKLAELGHDRFRGWWAQTTSELNLTNHAQMPTITCVLAAALSEGALAFVVSRARALSLPTMNSKIFNDPPTRWSFDELLKSAAFGGPEAIFDAKVRDRAERLNIMRQRIHAGRLMSQPGPVPDTRPEDANEAIETVNAILRRIIEWLQSHPAKT
jgi:hypothetical protein